MWRNRLKMAKEQELDEEILAHFEIEIQRRIDAGETRQHAELEVRRLFGNVGMVKEVTRGMWSPGWRGALAQDLKYAARGMRKAPAYSAVAILTIGLGIGASTAVFSVVNGILLRPLPYPQPERIAVLWRLAPISSAFGTSDFPWGKLDFSAFQEQTKAFDSLGAFEAQTFNLTGRGEPMFLEGMRASAGFFPALGVNPALGRFYTAEEDRKGHERVVVLGDQLWRERFGAQRSILGQSIELNGFSYTVIGVMPPGFSFPRGEDMPAILEFPREARLWVPLAISPGERGPSELAVVGRMREHATPLEVQADLDLFSHTYERLYPTAKEWSKSRAIPLQQQIIGDTKRPLVLLLGAVGLVLLIACSNVAGLVLTRSLTRRREFNLRAALGAGTGRLVRQLLTENLLLAAIGGLVGIGLAQAGVVFVQKFGPVTLPRLREISLDPLVFGFCAGLTLLTGFLFGLAPSFSAARGNLVDSLKAGGRVAGRQLSPNLRNWLSACQVALALVLVIAAGLLVRTFYSLLKADPGFRVEHVVTFEISLPPSKYPDPDRMAQLYSRARHALQALPGVESAGLVHAVPLGGAPDATVIRVPGYVSKPNEQLYANYMFASPGYFSATGTPLLGGRDFADGDTLASTPVTIINRAMANALWPGENPIGKHVGVATTKYPVRIVIGIVPNVKQLSLRENVAPQMYVPYSQNEIKIWPPMQTMQVALRTAADPAGVITNVREAMHGLDPDLPLAKVSALSKLVDESMTQSRFIMLLLAAFGGLALLLASVGMYGVISHSVAQRTQEIGIRIALGADRTTVFGMVLGQGARLAATGIGMGLAGAYATMRTLSSFLYGVSPLDPLTFATVSALLAAVALLASYLPARRATRVDPVVALRTE